MSNSEVNDVAINWSVEAAAPLSSWADEMDELDAIESPTPSSPTLTYDDTQLSESSVASTSSSDNEDGKSSPRDRSDQNDRSPLRDSSDRMARPSMPRRGSHSHSRRELRDSSSDLSSLPKTSVKEEVPFPVVAPFVAFITNLSLAASREDISKLMEPLAGVPKSIKIILEKETGRPRGFCYVEFEDSMGLRAAIDADGIDLLSQPLHIVVAEKKPTPQSRSNNGFSRRESSLRRSSDDFQERRQPRMDSASSSSKGKFDNQSMKTRKDDFRYQNQRSNSFTNDKRSFKPASGSAGREKSFPMKKELAKSDERPMSFGNMFSALQLTEDM